jgi:hypothetical protein
MKKHNEKKKNGALKNKWPKQGHQDPGSGPALGILALSENQKRLNLAGAWFGLKTKRKKPSAKKKAGRTPLVYIIY